MIGRIKKFKRYRDYYAIECFEVKASLIMTVFLTGFLLGIFEFYESFFLYQNDLKQILIVIVGGEFTLLGISLAGMAIITSLFSPDLTRIINRIDKNDTINRVLSQFEFSAFNLSIQISYIALIYFALISEVTLVKKIVFIFIFVIVCYHFFFNLFYIVALIGNCIKINDIKNKSDKIVSNEKDIIDIANELRIDYILALILGEKKINRDAMLRDLFQMIEQINFKDKQAIKDYLMNYYGK